MSRSGRHPVHAAAVLVLVLAHTACGSDVPPAPDSDTPWDEPVAGAAAVTEWRDDGEPVGPFGPGGHEWASPAELVEGMAGTLAQADDVTTAAHVISQSGDEAVGWVRAEAPGDDALAVDLLLHLRRGASGWFIATTESRVHCAVDLADGICS